MGDRAAHELYRWIQWGKPSDGMVPYHRPLGMPHRLAELGRLVHLEMADGRQIEAGSSVRVAVSAASPRTGLRSLYLVGEREVVIDAMGVIAAIVYEAAKGDMPPTRWRHAFTGNRPRLDRYAMGEARIARGRSRYTVTDWGIIG